MESMIKDVRFGWRMLMKSPGFTIIALVTLALALYGSFAWNATLSAVVRLVTYALICGALLVLRRRPELPGFRVPAGMLVAPAGIAFCLWLLATRSLDQAGVLAFLAATGPLLWLVSRRAR